MLVKDFRNAWRWFSVQLASVTAVVAGLWPVIADDVAVIVPPHWMPYIVSCVSLLIIVGRLIDQDTD